MTGIAITQAGLHAALTELRDRGGERDNDRDAAAFFIDSLNVLAALLTPQAPPEARLASVAELAAPNGAGLRHAAHTYAMTAGPAEGHTPSLVTPAAAVAPIATEAPAPAQAAGGPILRAKGRLRSGGHRPVAVWTDERKALLTEQFPNCADNQALLEQLSALPGDPIASLKAMMVQAGKMGLRRSAEAQRIIARRMGARGGERSLERQPAAPSPHMTQDRLDLFARLWCDPTISVRGIWSQVNELPGPKLTATQSLYNWAKKLGLSTQRPTLPEPDAEPEQVVVPEPDQPAIPPPLIEPIKPGDDKADAFEAFAAGQTVRQVATDFGLPVDVVVNWHAEWKATQTSQRAASLQEAPV